MTGTSTTTTAGGDPSSPFFDGETARLFVQDEILLVAVADTSAERSQGLMGVESLGGLDGMLFIHGSLGVVSYTMRNTPIPLDIWFIDDAGLVVGTFEMEPCSEDPCESYVSSGSVIWALETPAGAYDFDIGTEVRAEGLP